MRGDTEPTEPVHVLDHVACLTGKAVGSARHAERDVVPGRGADLDAVEHQHAVDVAGRIDEPRRVAVIGQRHEVEARPRRRAGDVLRAASPVGTARVHVNRAAHCTRIGSRRQRLVCRRHEDPDCAGNCEGNGQERNTSTSHRRG